ncbi:MAG: EthD domain-containing protein [Thermoleophilaceae bacterium]
MLKLFQFWTRRQDMTQDAAVRHLVEVHAPRIGDIAAESIERYASNVALACNYSGWIADEAPAYDGVGEFWFSGDDVGELKGALLGRAAVRGPGERDFIGTAQLMVAEQTVQLDRGRRHAGVKTMFLLTRRPEMTRDEAIAYWHDRHAPLVRDTLGDALVRYATNVGVAADLSGWPDEASPYDGVAELWLDLSMDEMLSTVAKAASVLLPDERAFLGTYRWLVVDEVVHRGGEQAPLPATPDADTGR